MTFRTDTVTGRRRFLLPHIYARKDARTSIYNAMYGRGNNNSNRAPAWDPNRRHTNPDQVSWSEVGYTIRSLWYLAAFDEHTLNKILADFNHYARGSTIITKGELV